MDLSSAPHSRTDSTTHGAHSDEELNHILQSLPDALLMVDGDARIVMVNRRTEELFGYGSDELLGQPIEMLIPERFRERHLTHRSRYIADPRVVPMGIGPGFLGLRKHGGEFPVEISLSPVSLRDVPLVLCIVRDVSEQRRAANETEMHLMIQRIISSILHASLSPGPLDELLEFALDQLFTIPWISHQAKGVVFLAAESTRTLVLKVQRGLPPAAVRDCAQVAFGKCLCGAAAETREPVYAGHVDERHTIRYDDIEDHGHYSLPVVSSGRLLGVISLYLKAGHVWSALEQSFLCSVADALAGAIERRQVAEALRKSEERFSLAVQGTDAGVFDWDFEASRVFFSPRWKSMLGYGVDEIADDYTEWEQRIHPEDRARALQTLRDYLDGRSQTYDLEHRLRHKDGTYRWILARGAVVRDDGGRPYRMVGSHLDVTASKHAEESVRHTTARLLAAKRIQEHILPRSTVTIPGFDIAGFLRPAAFAAGDHFDYLPMPGGAVGIMIGDVSGHGFDSALLMASVHAYLRLLAESHTDVGDILGRANSLLVEEIESGRYVTLLLGRLDPNAHSFTYVNAGHPAAYLLDARGEVKAQLTSTSMPLGLAAGTDFQAAPAVHFEPGDVLIMLTDGILEAESPEGTLFGGERVIAAVRRNRYRAAADIVAALYAAVCEFGRDKTPSDDVTGVVVKRAK